MTNNIHFLDYYLNFANNHSIIKKIIEEENSKLVLHSKNSKNKELLNNDCDIIFDNYYFIRNYIYNVKYKLYEDDHEKLEKKIHVDKLKTRLKKIIKYLCYFYNNKYCKVKIPYLIIVKNKQMHKSINNIVTNVRCVNDIVNDLKTFKFPIKTLYYLPSSVKTISIELTSIHFIKIENKYYNNIPNKLRIFSCYSYPGICWKKKIKLPINTILIIKTGRGTILPMNHDENINYSTIKSHITIIKHNNYNNNTISYFIKESNKKLILYEQKVNGNNKKQNITFTMKEID
jgi:hypothetical protein